MRLPTIAATGVPMCSREACPLFVAGICSDLGYCPLNVCEPHVIAMALALRKPCPSCGAEFVDATEAE